MSGMEDIGVAAREAGEKHGDLKDDRYGALRSHKEYADLRTELAAIISEIGSAPDKVGGIAAETSAEDDLTSPETDRKGIVSIIAEIAFYAGIAVIVAGMLIFSAAGGSSPRTVFGYSAMIMLTGSMQSEIPKDSLVITKHSDPQTIQIGDDISFTMRQGFVVTHRVIGIHEQFSDTGERGFETKGIDNSQADRDIVPAANVIGAVVFHSENIGNVIILIRENMGITIIAVALAIGLITFVRFLIKSKHKSGREDSSF